MPSNLFIIFLFITAISFSSCFAQKGFQEGYIITHNSDTTHGMLKDRKEGFSSKIYSKVQLKKGLFSKKYSAANIKGYCISNTCFESIWLDKKGILFNETYISRPGFGKRVFVKNVISGHLTLYHLEYVDSDSGTIDYIELLKKSNNDMLIRASQGLLGLKKKAVISYLSDCPELIEKINNNSIKNAREVVNFYNICKKH
jgi:hypothetical protein